MENNNTEHTTVESTNQNPSQGRQESKGGDRSRASTALILLAFIVPATIIASLLWCELSSNGIFGLISNIYLMIFQIGIGIFLVFGLNEAGSFIFPIDEDKHGGNTAYWTLMVLGLVPFVIYSLGMFDLTNGFNLGSWKTWFILISISYFVITAGVETDFKDITIAYFMVASFTLFVISLTWAIASGGWQFVVLCLGIAIMSDTFAYYGGNKYGKRKAFPRVSPSKSVEGLITGLLASIIFGLVMFILFFNVITFGIGNGNPLNNGVEAIIWIIFASIISPFGDLTFSKIKRTYGKKDFSNLLPGHGGIFDRLDSHIFVTTTLVFLVTTIH